MFLCCGSRRLVKAAERVGGPGPGAPSWGVGWGGRGGGDTLQQVELHMRLMLRTAGLKIWSALKVFSGEVW